MLVLPELRLKQKVLMLVAVPLIFQAFFIGVLGILLQSAEREALKERHSRAVVGESNALLNNFMTCAATLYYYNLTSEEILKTRFEQLCQEIPQQVELLRDMLKDSPNHAEALREMQVIGNKSNMLLTLSKNIVKDRGMSKGNFTQQFSDLVAELQSEVKTFVHHQQEIERVDPQKEAKARQLALAWLLLGFIGSVALAVVLALVFNRNITKRVDVMMLNTELLRTQKPLLGQVSGQDEIALLDKTIHELAKALDETSKRKQEIVAMVSHDLRTPLSSVMSTLTLLKEGVLGDISEQAKTRVKGASKSTARLMSLINDLLDAEKLESGKMLIAKRDICLLDIFESAIHSVGEIAEEKSITIDVPYSAPSVSADHDRVVQILVNLLSNAIKFSPEKSEIRVELAEQNEFVELRVIDNGRGVPEKFREAIFERFSQVESADGDRGKGTGLGLPICKMIVEALGGKIGCRSEGKGSTFWFTLLKSEPPR